MPLHQNTFEFKRAQDKQMDKILKLRKHRNHEEQLNVILQQFHFKRKLLKEKNE